MTVIDGRRWESVVSRDRRADGSFCYAVAGSGIYSRPSCIATPAGQENVLVFATCARAEAAGFRPCHRCRPDQPTLHERHTEAVVRACRVIDGAHDSPPNLEELADAAGFSRFHFHRLFKAMTGLTPHAYISGCRSQRVRAGLSNAYSVTDAIYGAGFNSNGRFYATSPEILGMTPTIFRAGGEGAHIRYHVTLCSMGAVLVATADRGVCAVMLGADASALAHRLRDWFPNARIDAGDRTFAGLVEAAVSRGEPPLASWALPHDVRAAVLRQRVRAALRRPVDAVRESGTGVAAVS